MNIHDAADEGDSHLVPDDLEFFSPEHDLFNPELTRTFNTRQLDEIISHSAHRALQVCNAMAQFMLANYQTDNEEDKKVAQVKAEHIAFDLGFEEFNPDRPCTNPFDEPVLKTAWEDGHQAGRQSNHNQPLRQLEEKYWEEGVNTEDTGCHYELCALQLYKLAAQLSDPSLAERAKSLAMEMCRYWEGETPSERRQAEIDRFMATQTARIASELDL